MFNRLESILKNIEGNVLTICIDNSLVDLIYKNPKTSLYSISSGNTHKTFKKRDKKKITNTGKSINIKKLRKYLKKNSSHYIIINMDEVYKYSKYIIKDTIYLNKNIVYIYASNEIDKEILYKRYSRYNVKIDITEYKNTYLMKIDTKDAKNNKFKDFIYFIKDTFYNIAEFIGNILIS